VALQPRSEDSAPIPRPTFVCITTFTTLDPLAFRMVTSMLFVIIGLIGSAWRVARVAGADTSPPAGRWWPIPRAVRS
jgi:hypothetical protein